MLGDQMQVSSPSKRKMATSTASHRRAALPHDRVEDRLHIGRRAGDDAKDLAGGRLLLQRLREVAVARLQLL